MGNILLKYVFAVLVVFSCVPKAHANFEALQEMLVGVNPEDASLFYADYLKNEDASPENIDAILGVIAGSLGGWQPRVYDAYMHRKNPDPNVIRQIIMTTHQSENTLMKAWVYSNYFEAPITLDPDLVTMIIEDSIDFMELQYEVAEVYETYLKRREVDDNVVKRILEIAVVENYELSEQITLYKAYIGRPDADKEIIRQILRHVQGFAEGEKVKVYQAYVQRKEVDPGIVADIFYQVTLFQNSNLSDSFFESVSQRAVQPNNLYYGYVPQPEYRKKVSDLLAYIKKTDADINLIEEKMQDVGSFEKYDQGRIFKAYFESPYASENQVNKIVQDLLNSRDGHMYLIFKIYLMGAYANKEFIEAVLLGTEDFGDYGKTLFYFAYLIAKNNYLDSPDLFRNTVFDTIADPIHLKALLQDDQIRINLKERVKGELIELDAFDASVLWKILGMFSQGSFTKGAVH